MKSNSFKLVFCGTPLFIFFIIKQCCIAQEGKKVCLGSGLTKDTEPYTDYYSKLYNMYNACQIVLGNIEISYLESHHDLSFLKSIEEVGGYISFFSNKVKSIPLENLRLIRGNTLYYQRYALHIAAARRTYDDFEYQEITMRSLTEILRGGVYIGVQPGLCYLNYIKWNEIVNTDDANNTIDIEQFFSECQACDSQCGGYCWGPGPENCQKFTKNNCHPLCPNRCRGPSISDCCDDQCASGCTGSEPTHCLTCRKFSDGETCKESCPPLKIYNQSTYQINANPHGMYSLLNHCYKECPHNFKHTEEGECVFTCNPDSEEEVEEHGLIFCKKLKGKRCNGIGTGDLKNVVSVTSSNIDSFKDCNRVLGNLVILPSASDSFKSDYEKLSIFKTIREITGFLLIMWWPKQYSDLNPFENLEIIHGTATFEGYSLIVTRLSINSLGLTSLKEIKSGNVLIRTNKNLCYVDSINWRTILKTDQQTEIEDNQSHKECAAADKMCDPLCAVGGCWGPGPFQCVSCHTFSPDRECLQPCKTLKRHPHGNRRHQECFRCHSECMIQPVFTCTGPGADECVTCAHYKDGPFCVKSCPEGVPGKNDTVIWKYPDQDGVCQLCHTNCIIGCKGPGFENCKFLGQKEKSSMEFRKPWSSQANATCMQNEDLTSHQGGQKLDVLIRKIHLLSRDMRAITYQQNFTLANVATILSLQQQHLNQQVMHANESKTQCPSHSKEDRK